RVVYENAANPFSVEFGVALALLHLRGETGGRLRAEFAAFAHELEDVAEVTEILACPVRHNASWNGFALSHEAWRLPLRRRDPILRRVLEQHVGQVVARLPLPDGIVGGVRRVLAARIAKGELQIQSVARELAVSARSLQRRLAEAGVTYQELLDRTRR